MQADGETYRHNETNRRFLQFENVPKNVLNT